MDEEYMYKDNIYILDTKTKIFTESKIQCPTKGRFQATISNNPESDRLLTFAFMRNNCKSYNFPSPLIELINRWVCNQEIYLLQMYSGEHWKIHIDHILNDIN